MNPWSPAVYRLQAGLKGQFKVYDLSGRPVPVQDLKRTGIYALKTAGDGTLHKVVITR